jgi:hypothetical protein
MFRKYLICYPGTTSRERRRASEEIPERRTSFEAAPKEVFA